MIAKIPASVTSACCRSTARTAASPDLTSSKRSRSGSRPVAPTPTRRGIGGSARAGWRVSCCSCNHVGAGRRQRPMRRRAARRPARRRPSAVQACIGSRGRAQSGEGDGVRRCVGHYSPREIAAGRRLHARRSANDPAVVRRNPRAFLRGQRALDRASKVGRSDQLPVRVMDAGAQLKGVRTATVRSEVGIAIARSGTSACICRCRRPADTDQPVVRQAEHVPGVVGSAAGLSRIRLLQAVLSAASVSVPPR